MNNNFESNSIWISLFLCLFLMRPSASHPLPLELASPCAATFADLQTPIFESETHLDLRWALINICFCEFSFSFVNYCMILTTKGFSKTMRKVENCLQIHLPTPSSPMTLSFPTSSMIAYFVGSFLWLLYIIMFRK